MGLHIEKILHEGGTSTDVAAPGLTSLMVIGRKPPPGRCRPSLGPVAVVERRSKYLAPFGAGQTRWTLTANDSVGAPW